MASYPLEIVTPDGVAFSGDVTSLVAPATEGYLGVLAHHAPMVCALLSGLLRLTAGGKTRTFAISGGFLEVTRKKTLVLTEEFQELTPGVSRREAVAQMGRRAAEREAGRS